MVNTSKTCDPRFLKKWDESSRVSRYLPKPNPSSEFPEGEEIVIFDKVTMFPCWFWPSSSTDYPWQELMCGEKLKHFLRAANTRRKPLLYIDLHDSIVVIVASTLQIIRFGSRKTFYASADINLMYFLENGRGRIQQALDAHKAGTLQHGGFCNIF